MAHAWTKTLDAEGDSHFAHHWQGQASGLVIRIVQRVRTEWVVHGPVGSGFGEGRGYHTESRGSVVTRV